MNKILGLITASAILISCQKEINFANSGSQGSASLLVREDFKAAIDSSSIVYVYDANKRLIKQITTGTSGGQDITTDVSLVRNSSGIITQTVFKSPQLQAFGIDSLVAHVYYDNSSKKYTAVSQVFELYGLSVIDSTSYNYSGNNVIESNEYQTLYGLTYLAYKSDYSYAGQNLTTVKSYVTDSTGIMTLAATYKFTFDNKTNPLILPAGEAFVLGNYFTVSANNPLNSQILTGTNTSSSNYTYTYNTYNVPQTAKMLDDSGSTTNVTFYYQ